MHPASSRSSISSSLKSPIVLRLSPRQRALLATVSASPTLKRRIIESTAYLDEGTVVSVGPKKVRTGRRLGSGLVGVVYEAECLATGTRFAYKRARGRLAFFQEAFRVERAIARRLEGGQALGPAPVVAASAHALLKPLFSQDTLQSLLTSDRVTARHRRALIDALTEAADFLSQTRAVLDLSPKNLCWDHDRWVLLDSGPKTHDSALEDVLHRPRWDAYLRLFRRKLGSEASVPSVLHRPAVEPCLNADTFVFIHDFWRWFPIDETLGREQYHVDVSEDALEDEVIFSVRDGEVTVEAPQGRHPLIQRTAEVQWQTDVGGPCPIESQDLDMNPSPIAPCTWAASARGPGVARTLMPVFGEGSPLRQPNLRVTPYQHWSDIFRNAIAEPQDLFCHESMVEYPEGLEAAIAGRNLTRFSLPPRKDGGFGHLTMFDVGTVGRAVIFVPGFRAPPLAAGPLAKKLADLGVQGRYVLADLGVQSDLGQRLVSAGRFEAVLLFDLIDHLVTAHEVSEVAVFAASQGIIGAVLAARLHPAVTALVLDSPMVRPYDIYRPWCKTNEVSLEALLDRLGAHGMPQASFDLGTLHHERFRTLILRSSKDRFAELCGPLEGETVVPYEGCHAQTMRHDTAVRGLPEDAVKAAAAFLR